MLPTVADVLALDPVRRGAPRVLAGSDRLDTPVRWVHVIELAETRHLLRGGELVLSTGIALPPDPAGLASYVAGLAAAGASALAVELGARYVRELPRPLVAAAAEHRLPLIVLERETQFIAITEAVHAQILDAQVTELRAAQRLHQVFTDLALGGASTDEIVRQASLLAGAPVILADLAHRVLACEAAGQEAAALLAGFAARSRGVRVSGPAGYDQASGWFVASVGGQAGAWGRLIIVPARPQDPGLAVLAQQAAATIALAKLVCAERDDSPQRLARRSVLADLTAAGYADLPGLRARIIALGVPLQGRGLLPVVVQLAKPADRETLADRAGTVEDMISAVCLRLGVPAVTGVTGPGRVAALLATPPEASPDRLLDDLAGLLRSTGAISAADAIGLGWPADDLGQARAAFRQASQAACAALAYGIMRPYVALADLGLAGLFYQLRAEPALAAFTERQIGALLAQDESAGTDLVRVLTCYLEAGGGKAEAARRAGLARPTLYERLRQIEQILGKSVESAESRLALHAALLGHRAAARSPGYGTPLSTEPSAGQAVPALA
jgi:purine catabolism regulator